MLRPDMGLLVIYDFRTFSLLSLWLPSLFRLYKQKKHLRLGPTSDSQSYLGPTHTVYQSYCIFCLGQVSYPGVSSEF